MGRGRVVQHRRCPALVVSVPQTAASHHLWGGKERCTGPMEKDDRKGGYGMVSLSEVVDRKEFIARAEACLEQDPAQAVDLALERLRVYPDDVEAKIILGIGWYRKGEKAPALDVLRGL